MAAVRDDDAGKRESNPLFVVFGGLFDGENGMGFGRIVQCEGDARRGHAD